MKDVSFLIPARNEIYLEQTIRNVLANIRGNSEILVCLDGWIPDPQIVIGDDRVKFFHKETAIGQRAAINFLARQAEGKYVCKLDAHCTIGEGFDLIMMADCEYNWTVIPRMYNLDVDTFKPKYFENFEKAVRQRKVHDYMYIYINERGELRTQYYPDAINRKLHFERKDILVDETMSCMGPCFFMHRDWFWETGGCDEAHEGGWGQQAVEVACKAWLSGGKLMVNKKTYFSHWFRGHLGWPYPISGNTINRVRQYSKDLWLNDKWPKAKRKFNWMIDKFNPPGWENKEEAKQMASPEEPKEEPGIGEYPTEEEKMFLFKKMYWHIIKRSNFIRWRGHIVLKFPNDLMLYQRVIRDFKPDFIVETGTFNGGSAFYLADICELNKRGHIITIDRVAKSGRPEHPRITYLTGDSASPEILDKVKQIVGNKSVMLILDSDHSEGHVTKELEKLSPLVTKGQFLVIEDCYGKFGEHNGPYLARDKFLAKSKEFKLTDYEERFLVGVTMGGWLQKI